VFLALFEGRAKTPKGPKKGCFLAFWGFLRGLWRDSESVRKG